MAVMPRSFFPYGSSLVPIYDCGSCLLPQADERIMVPKIDLEQIKGFIDEVPYITELQKTFYKRFEQILKPAYDMVMSEKQEMSEPNMTM